MQVRSLGWENPLEESTATHSSILAWRILWTEELGGLQSTGSQSRIRLKQLSTHVFLLSVRAGNKESESHLIVSDSLQPHGLNSPWGVLIIRCNISGLCRVIFKKIFIV